MMLHRVLAFALGLGVSLGSQAAFIDDPGGGAYWDGYKDGYKAAGVDFERGRFTGHEECRRDPAACSIQLTNVLPPAQYGEAEPNNMAISANPLTLNANFWGQSYGADDEDWFYLVAPEPGFNLTVNFSLPQAKTGDLTGWNVSVRNALGMILAQFDTGFMTVEHASAGISYRTTLGLAGTYYVVVRPVAGHFSFQPYNLAVNLQPSPNQTPAYAGGFYDAEIEPNDAPAQATWIGRGVSLFGTINLRFDTPPICDATACVYAQNEDDWFIYSSPGNEIINLSFCDRTQCAPGAWFVQIFDAAAADAIQHHGLTPDSAKPLLAFNTEYSDTETPRARVWTLGLREPGVYFMRVGHQRTFKAPCLEWALDLDNNGIPDRPRGSCACDTAPTCQRNILNPQPPMAWPICPNGSGGGANAYCDTQCVCINTGTTGCTLYQTDDNGDGLPGPNAQPCRCLPETAGAALPLRCNFKVPNPGTPRAVPAAAPGQAFYPPCPDGSGGSDNPQCAVGCVCTQTGGEVRLPHDANGQPTYLTSQYNFTWNSSLFGSPR